MGFLGISVNGVVERAVSDFLKSPAKVRRVIRIIVDNLNDCIDSPEEVQHFATLLNGYFDVPLLNEAEEQELFVALITKLSAALEEAEGKLRDEA